MAGSLVPNFGGAIPADWRNPGPTPRIATSGYVESGPA